MHSHTTRELRHASISTAAGSRRPGVPPSELSVERDRTVDKTDPIRARRDRGVTSAGTLEPADQPAREVSQWCRVLTGQ